VVALLARRRVQRAHHRRRFEAALASPLVVSNLNIDVEASIGIALSGVSADAEQFLHEADLAMYRTKRRRGGGHDVLDVSELLRAEDEAELDQRRGVLTDDRDGWLIARASLDEFAADGGRAGAYTGSSLQQRADHLRTMHRAADELVEVEKRADHLQLEPRQHRGRAHLPNRDHILGKSVIHSPSPVPAAWAAARSSDTTETFGFFPLAVPR
jgi:hypothetical protein